MPSGVLDQFRSDSSRVLKGLTLPRSRRRIDRQGNRVCYPIGSRCAAHPGSVRHMLRHTSATNYNRSGSGSRFDLQTEGGWNSARYYKIHPVD